MHEKKSDFLSIKDFGSTGKLISQIKKLWKDIDFRKALEQKVQGPAFERVGALLIKQIALAQQERTHERRSCARFYKANAEGGK